MDCKNCLVLELTYEIRFEGSHNVSNDAGYSKTPIT